LPIKINPRKIRGPWADGYALDLHTLGSTFLGHNAYGHPEFDTQRSPLGDLLYRLKNGGDQTVIPQIIEAVATFLVKWKIPVDAIVPVPPSNTRRANQPVMAIASALSVTLGVPLCEGCVTKNKSTAQLKDVFDFKKRAEILSDAFGVDVKKTGGKRLLLLDDLYRSGATASAIAQLLTSQGAARAVYLLTLTQTRKLA
jgi:competence protein ComFC